MALSALLCGCYSFIFTGFLSVFHLSRVKFYVFTLVLAVNSWGVMAETPARSPIQVAAQQLLSLNSYIQGERELSYIINDQSILDALNSDLTAVVDVKSLSSGLPLGAGVMEWSISADQTKLTHKNLWRLVTDEQFEQFTVPRASVKYGVNDHLNLGLNYMKFTGVGVEFFGLEFNQLLSPKEYSWAAVLRGTYTQVNGHPEVRFQGNSAELIGSFFWQGVRPYVGLGWVEGRAKVNLTEFTDLTKSRQSFMKQFVGAEVKLQSFKIAFELGLEKERFYQGFRLSYSH
jgi:hypothetical protein